MTRYSNNKLADQIRFAAAKSDLASLRVALYVFVKHLSGTSGDSVEVMEQVAKILGVELPKETPPDNVR